MTKTVEIETCDDCPLDNSGPGKQVSFNHDPGPYCALCGEVLEQVPEPPHTWKQCAEAGAKRIAELNERLGELLQERAK